MLVSKTKVWSICGVASSTVSSSLDIAVDGSKELWRSCCEADEIR